MCYYLRKTFPLQGKRTTRKILASELHNASMPYLLIAYNTHVFCFSLETPKNHGKLWVLILANLTFFNKRRVVMHA